MIEAILYFIIDLLFDGAEETSKSRRVSRVVRWIVVIVCAILFVLLGLFMLLGAYMMSTSDDSVVKWILGIAGIGAIAAAIEGIWRLARSKGEEQEKEPKDYSKQNPEVLAEIDAKVREKAKEVKS